MSYATSNNLRGAVDLQPDRASFLHDVQAGLAQQQKTLPCKWLYDEAGSQLFEQICELPEYYPTRTEIGLLRAIAPEIAERIGAHARIVELGSGAGVKVRILLDAMQQVAAYIPVDISRSALLEAAESLARDHEELLIAPVCADYTKPFVLPAQGGTGPVLGFFPGSTIGNFSPSQALGFLTQLRRQLGRGAWLLVGVDLKKDPAILEPAYDDAAGVTAAFNLNLLARINRELGGNFDLSRFRHVARYDQRAGRIEMHLESLCDQTAWVDGQEIAFAQGETIHTENSYKYDLGQFQQMARTAGYQALAAWTDPCQMFSLHLLQA